MNRKVYLNHDGGVDDLVSLFLLLNMPDVELVGVGVIPADCYLEPAVSASKKIIHRFGKEQHQSIRVAASDSRPVNPFPKDWRMHAFLVDALPVLNEHQPVTVADSDLPAHLDLVRAVRKSDTPVDLVFIGPLTDLARALDADPEIERHIGTLYWMGGTFLPQGNVEEPEHNGTAEWNAFWDPQAVARVWNSNLTIQLVALESTNKVPLTIEVRQKWASARQFIGLDFVGQCYALVPPLVHFQTNSTYFLWDVLTTAAYGQPQLVAQRAVHSEVVATGPAQGQTIVSDNGRLVQLVHDVDREAFFTYITELAKKA